MVFKEGSGDPQLSLRGRPTNKNVLEIMTVRHIVTRFNDATVNLSLISSDMYETTSFKGTVVISRSVGQKGHRKLNESQFGSTVYVGCTDLS